ncbi:folate family ECF transporter S component [Thermovenabulum sp.]|uniref:folate family ECF transporter S component n=1 Tax=Thermovenabulum sp. TaxID=3100335 RepID=UPI003C7D1C3C
MNKDSAARKITYMAMLIVLNIILTRIASIRIALGNVEAIRIGFGGLPLIFGGILMGPMAGGIIGAVGDIVGYGINPMGPYMPHFTLTSALTGIIPALVLKIMKTKNYRFWEILFAIAVGQTLTSILLVPYFLNKLFGIPLIYKMTTAAITQAVNIPLYALLIKILLKRINLPEAITREYKP